MTQDTLSAAAYRKAAGLPEPGADKRPERNIARARRTAAERMNKTEAAYAERLDLMKRAGEILDWRFEAITLKLADGTRYTPDFLVTLWDGERTELHEVKGFWRDDARVKFRVAAEMYTMFRFVEVRRKNREWELIPLATGTRA